MTLIHTRLAAKRAELQAKRAYQIWLLVDTAGAKKLIAGTVPRNVKAQAAQALRWVRR